MAITSYKEPGAHGSVPAPHIKLAPADAAGLQWASTPEEPIALKASYRLARAAKLVFDMAIAVLLLVLLAPLLLVVVLLIQVESPGTPFYRARRVGYRGRSLAVLKFRKMDLNASGLPLTVAGDARLTRIGAFMTRTRIDELPQLWNVLRGQMSLVGPRPEDGRFVALHAEDYDRILQVRPGITGWAQLAYADEPRILDQDDPVGHYVAGILPAKVRLDMKYAERPRLIGDLATLMWTAMRMVLNADVAVHRETGRMCRRRPRLPHDAQRMSRESPRLTRVET